MSTCHIGPRPAGARQRRCSEVLTLVALMLLAGCAGTTSQRAPTHYAQSMNSAVDGCLRNPGCYTATPGDEAVIPWLSRTVDAARTAVAAAKVLDAAEVARIESILVGCAKDANFKVNEDEFGQGNRPTREQCNEVVRQENGKDVTRAMELGDKKHDLALACVQRELGKIFPENFTVQPRYKYDPQTSRWRMLDPKKVAEWIRDGLFDLLLGTLVPDVVIHESGNPDKVQRVYDYKFPCLPDTKDKLRWRSYPKGHPHHPHNQGKKYKDALLNGERDPSFVSPQMGVTQ
ncbi:hypothetical protein [Archangium lansingense]|uniref:Lipoprotein n=1 Tax=Archangium lansingense TaxID=2995310 RepID=A0ABT4AGK6_9BACT|nr:hypothetical protein [Archangium lansinium]MCY1080806.1 hypothetical protein [Archangium lansinium]